MKMARKIDPTAHKDLRYTKEIHKNYPHLAPKNDGDSYYTPHWVFELLPIDWSNYNTGFEPSMGDGRILHFLEEQGIKMDGRDLVWEALEQHTEIPAEYFYTNHKSLSL